MNLFHEHGYDGIGVADLAAAIGINPPSLYAAFGSKLGLFEQAVARYLADGGGFIAEALGQCKDAEDGIRRLFRAAADNYTGQNGCPGCLVMDSTRNCTDPGARALTRTCRDQTRAFLIRWLVSRDLKDAELLADTILVGLAGLSAAARDGMTRKSLRAAAERLAAGFASGLEKNAR